MALIRDILLSLPGSLAAGYEFLGRWAIGEGRVEGTSSLGMVDFNGTDRTGVLLGKTGGVHHSTAAHRAGTQAIRRKRNQL